MEQNTIGTTTQNIIFVKSVPSGSSTVAPGHTKPTMQPAAMPSIIVSRNQLFLKKFFISSILLYWGLCCYYICKLTQSKLHTVLETLQKMLYNPSE